MPDVDLDRLEALATAAYERLPYRDGTGWHWSGNVEGGFPNLALSAWVSGYGRCTVMDFERWGMQSAGPRFPDRAVMMQDARDLVTFEVGRRGIVGQRQAKADRSVYRYDVDGIAHPIPEYIAGADPQTVLALIAEVRRLRDAENLARLANDMATGSGATAAEIVDSFQRMIATSRLGERDALAAKVSAVRALAYASDDGSEYMHNGHEFSGEPDCPACWAADIRKALEVEP